MTNFEQHIGQELPQAILDHIDAHSTDELYDQAHKLKFDSICPVVMENDSPAQGIKRSKRTVIQIH